MFIQLLIAGLTHARVTYFSSVTCEHFLNGRDMLTNVCKKYDCMKPYKSLTMQTSHSNGKKTEIIYSFLS